jgi:glycosyltransferase involved in cell wall biosynthesis
MKAPLVSVIVPTRNRAAALSACLESLTSQTLAAERFEVIVVDNGSSDGTMAAAQCYSSRLPLVLLHEPDPGLHIGRHAGWRAARSEVLVFADDDIVATPGWLSTVASQFGADPDLAMLGGNNFPAFEHEPPPWLLWGWEQPVVVAGHRGRALGALSVLDFGDGVFDFDPGWVWGCNFSVRAAVLRAAGGFHPDGVPVERLHLRGDGETHVSEVVRTRGWPCRFDGGASVHHAVTAARMTPAYFEKRAFAQGISDSYTRVRMRGKADGLLARLRARSKRAIDSLQPRIPVPKGAGAAEQWKDIVALERRANALGQAFHQCAVCTDPSLRDWVLQVDYL